MKGFLEAKYPHFIGLTGSPEETETAKRNFRVFATRSADPSDPEGYAMPHSALTVFVRPKGVYTGHFADTLAVDPFVERLNRLIG